MEIPLPTFCYSVGFRIASKMTRFTLPAMILLTLAFIENAQSQISPRKCGFQQPIKSCLKKTGSSKYSPAVENTSSYTNCYSTYSHGYDFIRETQEPVKYVNNIRGKHPGPKTARVKAIANATEISYPWPMEGHKTQIFCHGNHRFLRVVPNSTNPAELPVDCNGHPDDPNTWFRMYYSFTFRLATCQLNVASYNTTDSFTAASEACCVCEPVMDDSVGYYIGMTASKIFSSETDQLIYMLTTVGNSSSLIAKRSGYIKENENSIPKPQFWGTTVNISFNGHNYLHTLKIEKNMRVFVDQDGVAKVKSVPTLKGMPWNIWEMFCRDPGQEFRLVHNGEPDY